ncbi:TetR/AcrR family transcriptional regulator [Apilactobacillus ozensis]|uniref:TetR/AcrR family transcriptional regulator n=1 Tax=Apilactobacillus ozensis TaxID=866801 RepID=UPI00200AF6C8|nr:TetR/AcrR family transcriptional regulator [Apilactobacillus ozensis]MCK8607156.1 TetR/AcrR family transcriptional regulator [Apilactobacillus ozensis]
MESAKSILNEQSFRKVNFSSISKKTKLSRSAIYQYYKNPEEILANILMVEFKDLNEQLTKNSPKNVNEMCDKLFQYIKNRRLLLKLLSLNFSIIEDNLSDKIFLNLKDSIFTFLAIVKKMLVQINPNLKNSQISYVQYSLLTTLSSIYPITHDDGNHLAMIRKVDATFIKPDYKELLEANIKNILSTIA